MWLDINHTKTILDHTNWEGEIRQVKCTSTPMKGMDLSPIRGLRSLREDCTPGKHQEIEVNISLTIYL